MKWPFFHFSLWLSALCWKMGLTLLLTRFPQLLLWDLFSSSLFVLKNFAGSSTWRQRHQTLQCVTKVKEKQDPYAVMREEGDQKWARISDGIMPLLDVPDFLVKSFCRGSLPLLKPKKPWVLFCQVSSSLFVTLLIVFSVDITRVVLWGWRRFFWILFWERLFPPRSLAGRGKFPEI